ncbi:MAG: D-alanyl-D-alanine carboxypeptidase family protein [Cyanothece sp. SIO1E1]|nr:D-alanyl-D-alanine carboxypeptidase family protein [Cyanothece sp. SIO1E1]
MSLVIAWQVPQLRLGQSVNPSTSIGSTRVEEPNSVDADAKTDAKNEDQSVTTDVLDVSKNDGLLGHLPYEEAPLITLEAVVADGSIKLRKAAAEKFMAMQTAAQQKQLTLLPISGFRSVTDQEYLFFEIKEQRGQLPVKRAEVSAPPGHSEHHTGYAIDIGDGSQPKTDLETSFETTPVFKWLQENAAYYSFEMSFPRDNPQGVSYEPWHWRFVGDRHSLETFYKAQDNQQQAANLEPVTANP